MPPNRISWVTNVHGVNQLYGQVQYPYTDNRNLPPPFQLKDLVIQMFENARIQFSDHPNMRYILRVGFGVTGTNRYNHNLRGTLNENPNPSYFFDRIENMLDSNDTLDIRDIRLLMDFIP